MVDKFDVLDRLNQIFFIWIGFTGDEQLLVHKEI